MPFPLDMLWAILPGVDSANLVEKYPGRLFFVHLKDLLKGVATGEHSAKTALTNDERLGTGQVGWPALIRAAEKTGAKQYFIEDESPISVAQIPESPKFLRGLKS